MNEGIPAALLSLVRISTDNAERLQDPKTTRISEPGQLTRYLDFGSPFSILQIWTVPLTK